MFSLRVLVPILLGCLLGVLPAQGQIIPEEPFGTLDVHLSGTRNVNRNVLHDFWQHGQGGELTIATPFYAGVVDVSAAFHRYAATADVPGFDALLLQTGWGVELELRDRFYLASGARLGNYRMTFDEHALPGVRTESEFAITFHSRLAARIAGPWSLHISGQYLKTFTFIRLKLWYLSIGLSRRLRTPHWLKTFLQ